jgi:hypothetical protein
MLFVTTAQAMEIRQFDKMADRNHSDVIQVLVDGAQKVLRDEGRGDLAKKMDQLFTEIPAGDKISLGMEEFENNLALMRVNDAKHAVEHPSDPRLEVEDVMAATLQNNHIDLPDRFFTVAGGFIPKYPPTKN